MSYQLPTWEEVNEKKVDRGEDLDAIEDFVWEETPAEAAMNLSWRSRFGAALSNFSGKVVTV